MNSLVTIKGNISIHAPTRGATLSTPVTSVSTSEFQSTLLREERLFAQKKFRKRNNYFNPRSYERSDSNAKNVTSYKGKFQSTLLREERLS